jgi:hypothetical protein
MNPDDLEVLKKHFDAFEPNLPAEGGDIQIIRGPNKGFVAIVGDRTALIRLATAILKYAIRGNNAPDQPNEKALVLDNFFPPSSPARDFMVQIEDASSKSGQPAKPHSLIKTVVGSLFNK